MKLEYYKSFYSPRAKMFAPGVKSNPLTRQEFLDICQSEQVNNLIKAYREGDKEAKRKLPAVTWCGYSVTGVRRLTDMQPTGYYIVDIDHMNVFPQSFVINNPEQYGIRLIHITPSGKGMRIVARQQEDINTLIGNMQWLEDKLKLSLLGDFDTAVKDVSRLSFVPKYDEILFISDLLFNEDFEPTITAGFIDNEPTTEKIENSAEIPSINSEDVKYNGWLVSEIVSRYIDTVGKPTEGERHIFYNSLCRDFRNIVDNNPYKLCAVLPAFEGSEQSRLSQCKSICRTNTSVAVPYRIKKFLAENGYSQQRVDEDEPAKPKRKIPTPPPVFKELLKTAPEDFKFPLVQALLPIIGTLTSHLRSTYWYDNRQHSTQFFSVIYGGSGMGKGFVEKMIDIFHTQISMRDAMSSAREQIYNRIVTTNKKNDKDPDNPRVSLRIIEPKCSEADFLEKQQANGGHHMFTYAAEMDQWRKGVRAAGGNKDDMLRIAWDNGIYGQNFKSANTFKGRVRLFWNVLITGTKPQLEKYFINCENGLVGRCGFSEVRNQEFATPPEWKKLSAKEMKLIDEYVERMDLQVYGKGVDEESYNALTTVSDEEFDNVIKWKHSLCAPVNVNIDWMKEYIDNFLEEQRKFSVRDQDYARDSFRRRVAVKGFRLALLCTSLYENISEKDKRTIGKFVDWFMKEDIEEMLTLWGKQYNALYEHKPVNKRATTIFDTLGDTFTADDIKAACARLNYLTPAKVIICQWKSLNLIKKTNKNTYKKL